MYEDDVVDPHHSDMMPPIELAGNSVNGDDEVHYMREGEEDIVIEG